MVAFEASSVESSSIWSSMLSSVAALAVVRESALFHLSSSVAGLKNVCRELDCTCSLLAFAYCLRFAGETTGLESTEVVLPLEDVFVVLRTLGFEGDIFFAAADLREIDALLGGG